MYKKQMLMQKIVCMMMLIASVLVFISALGFSTDLYDAFSKLVDYPNSEYEYTRVPGAEVYYRMHDFNTAYTRIAIGLILVSLVLFLTNTHSRRKYYIGNYIATGLSAAAAFGVSIWCIPSIIGYKDKFRNTVDFQKLKDLTDMGIYNNKYIGPDDTFWFDICFVVLGFLILTACLLIANCVFKVMMMKAEQRAIGSGKDE